MIIAIMYRQSIMHILDKSQNGKENLEKYNTEQTTSTVPFGLCGWVTTVCKIQGEP